MPLRCRFLAARETDNIWRAISGDFLLMRPRARLRVMTPSSRALMRRLIIAFPACAKSRGPFHGSPDTVTLPMRGEEGAASGDA